MLPGNRGTWHMCVKNLPRVVTWKWNSRPVGRKYDALTYTTTSSRQTWTEHRGHHAGMHRNCKTGWVPVPNQWKSLVPNFSSQSYVPWWLLLLLLLDNQQTPLNWDITLMTRCRGSELLQAIPEDVQRITLDSRPIECIPLRNCAREERVLALNQLTNR